MGGCEAFLLCSAVCSADGLTACRDNATSVESQRRLKGAVEWVTRPEFMMRSTSTVSV